MSKQPRWMAALGMTNEWEAKGWEMKYGEKRTAIVAFFARLWAANLTS